MKIAVIDDGINPSFYDIGDLVLDLEVTPELKMINRKEVDEVNSHGTICAAIIKKYCYNTQFISIKILDSSYGISTPEQLIVAVNWCVKNKIKIVNLSLGTIDYRDFDSIKKCINEAAQNGLIIIAAGNNEGNISYPAFLSNVVGVRHKSKIYNSKKYILREFPADGIECETPGIHTLISNNGISKATFPANSYAAPYITAIISEYIQNKKDDNIDILDVKNFLKKKESGAYVKKIYQKNRKIDWVQNALIT